MLVKVLGCGLSAAEPSGIEPSPKPDSWLVKTWQDEDGLPSSIINAIAQTPDGYLWLGTPLGLVRFDGVRAIIVKDETAPKSFKPRITALHVDHAGRLWLGDFNGVVSSLGSEGFKSHVKGGFKSPRSVFAIEEDEHGCFWIGQSGGWSRLTATGIPANSQFSSDERTALKFDFKRDPQGRLWAVAGGTLYRVENDEFKPVFSLANGGLRAGTARAGGLWLVHQTQLSRFTPEGAEEKITSLAPLIGTGEITVIYEDRTGNLWLGTTSQGLFCYAHGQFTKVAGNRDQITALWEDREENLWAGSTGGGLSRIRPRRFHMLDTRDGLVKTDVRTLLVASNNLYAAGQRWAMYYTNGRFAELADQMGVPVVLNGTVQTLEATTDGSLWLGTERNGLYRWQNGLFERIAGLPAPFIGALMAGHDGGIWIGMRRHGLAYWRDRVLTNFTTTPAIGTINSPSLAEDYKGGIWIGTYRGRLVAFHDGQFASYEPQDGQPSKTIHCLWPNTNGSVWAGTDGGGVLLFDHGKFSRLTTDNGLHNDFIYALHLDEQGQVWFGSAQGLFRIAREQIEAFARGERQDVESFPYGRSEGLASIVFNSGPNPNRQTADGRLWFATRKGVLVFDPRAVPVQDAPPPVHLESVLVNGRPVPLPKSVTKLSRMELPPRLENIEFTFTAPALTAPERVKLLYQLEGWDATWQDGSTLRRAAYGRLPAGDYRFHVMARAPEGTWNREGAMFAFTVLPTFWQTLWFRTLASIAGMGLLTAGIRLIFLRRLRMRMAAAEREQALFRERERIAADLHDDVGANLTHLAKLSELACDDASTADTNPRLGQIARAARRTIEIMDEIVWTMNPRNDSLQDLVGYLGEYATGFFSASSMQLRTELPEYLPELKLTSEVRHDVLLAVKESLNNAMKHSAARSVVLQITVTAGELRIVVRDDGKGFTPGAISTGDGLGNLRRRLQSCGGTLQLASVPGQGTTVTISLVLNPNLSPTI